MELNGLLSFLHSHIKKRLERYEFQYHRCFHEIFFEYEDTDIPYSVSMALQSSHHGLWRPCLQAVLTSLS